MKPPAGLAPESFEACIGLGSNVGDRQAHLRAAVDGLRALPRTELLAVSDTIQTEPVGPVPQGPYLNAAALVRTRLAPRELLHALLAIELARGRDRAAEQRWGPRTLDLDLLLYADHVIDEPGLTVPHPRLHQRRFVLGPLAQIAGGMRIPGRGRTVHELLAAIDLGPSIGEPPCKSSLRS